jgi:hypothetical protein
MALNIQGAKQGSQLEPPSVTKGTTEFHSLGTITGCHTGYDTFRVCFFKSVRFSGSKGSKSRGSKHPVAATKECIKRVLWQDGLPVLTVLSLTSDGAVFQIYFSCCGRCCVLIQMIQMIHDQKKDWFSRVNRPSQLWSMMILHTS